MQSFSLATALPRAAIVGLSLALAACSTTPAAQVTRFHPGIAPPPGTVSFRPAVPEQAGTMEFQAQADAVGAQLVRLGFQPVASANVALYSAIINMSVTERVTQRRNSGMSVGIGGGFSSGNVGMGSSVSVPVGRTPPPDVASTTTLAVTLRSNTANQSVWEGRSSLDTQAGGMRGTPLAPILSETLFREFPGPAGRTVSVPIR